MTARPIRYQRQVSDRKGKIFYTSITSLSHISKRGGIVLCAVAVLSALSVVAAVHFKMEWYVKKITIHR